MADPPPVLKLLVEKGPRKGKYLKQCAGAVLRVGRVVKGNDLAVGDAGVSQRHLDIAFLPPPVSRWAAIDLGSSNGTFLNGAALVPTIPAPLSHGDRIKIGETTELSVSIAADAGPEPAATRGSMRHAAAAVQEENKAPAVRRGRRKAPAAAVHPEEVKGESEVGTRRGRRKKAPAVVDHPEEEDEPAVVTRRGGRKKAPVVADHPEEEDEPAVVTRRGGRKKASAVADHPEEEKEEAAVVTRRGGRKKAVERPEAEVEKEEEVLPQPQPRTTRLTRSSASRRADAMGTGQGKGESEQTRRGRKRLAWQSASMAKEAIHEEEEEGEVAVFKKQKGTAAKSAREKDGISNSSAVEVQVALSKPAESTRKAKDTVIEEDAEKEVEDVGARECRGIVPQVTEAKGGNGMEDERITESGEVVGASKAEADQVVLEEGDGPLAPRGLCPVGCHMENMTLREWFVRIEEYILANNHEATQKAFAEVEQKHRRVVEYNKTL